MVGGKIAVLQESLANEVGMEPIGPAFDFKDEDVEHLGKPIAEIMAMGRQ